MRFMALSQTSTNLLSSLTGNVNKAYLLLPRPKARQTASASGTGFKAQLASAASNMENRIQTTQLRNAAAALQGASGLAGSTANTSVFGVSSSVVAKANAAGFIPIQVQYNPSSLSLESAAGRTIRQSVGGSGESMFQQMEVPEETVLRMELVFDAVNIKDAFMWDNLRLSTGDILQAGKSLATAAKGGYTVHKTVEALIGAICRAPSRIVGVVWNKMYFWGEMFDIRAEYTMFNRDGNPVRAKVALQIRQDEPTSTSNGRMASATVQTDQYWKEAYQKLFKSVYEGGAVDGSSKIGNLLNL
jgi:hypothetical protein